MTDDEINDLLSELRETRAEIAKHKTLMRRIRNAIMAEKMSAAVRSKLLLVISGL